MTLDQYLARALVGARRRQETRTAAYFATLYWRLRRPAPIRSYEPDRVGPDGRPIYYRPFQ